MIEAVNFWNEPNNKSHWDFEVDPEWKIYSEMVKLAAKAAKTENPGILRVLGGMSPIDPSFLQRLKDAGVLEDLNAVAVHGFPLDWNLWCINEWPDKIAEIE
jgi:beta-xylosidase